MPKKDKQRITEEKPLNQADISSEAMSDPRSPKVTGSEDVRGPQKTPGVGSADVIEEQTKRISKKQ